MNITLSADEQVVEKSRRLARQQGTSLNQMIRDYLEQLVGSQQAAAAAEEFRRLALKKGGRSAAGFRFNRETANARR